MIIARQEQELGNYRVAHQILFDTHRELRSHNIAISQDLTSGLMLLHSSVARRPRARTRGAREAPRCRRRRRRPPQRLQRLPLRARAAARPFTRSYLAPGSRARAPALRYVLVKSRIQLGDNLGAARLLIRVAKSISKFPSHIVPILTKTVIECHRADLKMSAFEYACQLMQPEHKPQVRSCARARAPRRRRAR